MVTRLPDSKFLNKSREKGGKVVCFDPNYSATAEKATEWVRLKPDTDAAFVLGMCKYLVDNKLYDAKFMKNYTDMPILINPKTGKRILADEVEGLTAPSGLPEYRASYVAYDEDSDSLVATNPNKIGNTPGYALTGTRKVTLKKGGTVEARTGFDLLCDELKEYSPEKAAKICDVSADTIERIAKECSSTKPMHIIVGGSAIQWHHGDLKGRCCALLASLTGNIGQLGGGISTYVGQYKTRFNTASWFVPPRVKKNSMPFHYAVNGPTKTMSAPYPKSGMKALVVGWGNPFEQHNVANWLRQAKESGDLECVICFDFQHTKTVDYSDVAFAAASWYEKTELVITPLHPWVQIMQPMVDPPGIAQPEIWICKELARHLDPSLADMWPEFDQDGAEKAAEDVLAMLLKNGGPTIDHLTVKDLKKGPGKLRHANPGEKHIPFYEQIHDGEPFPTVSRPNDLEVTAGFVKSGRIEFYKDEDMFLKMKEQLPVYKPAFEETEWAADPEAKDKYPFSYLTRNSAYRVHATYSNNPMMIELQDRTPKVFMNPDDAAAKGLEQGDVVEVFNSRGQINGALICDPGMYPGQVIFDQGWWSRYTGGESYNSLIWPWINPIHEIYYVSSVWSPNMAWNECVCDVRLLEKGAAKDKVTS
ncbi:MAG: molybdopterin-containing oxidoreductase family protein [Eggerthellaceae bacterium]|jgi:anaerobic selenocysteine-containing dehydrogenase